MLSGSYQPWVTWPPPLITLYESLMDVILGHLVEIGKNQFSKSSQACYFKASLTSLTSTARMTSSMGLPLCLRLAWVFSYISVLPPYFRQNPALSFVMVFVSVVLGGGSGGEWRSITNMTWTNFPPQYILWKNPRFIYSNGCVFFSYIGAPYHPSVQNSPNKCVCVLRSSGERCVGGI